MKMFLKTTLNPACGLVLLWLVTVTSGCTKKFDEFNTDQTKLEVLTALEFPRLFTRALAASSYINWRYQYGQNLYADVFAQYFYLTNGYPSDRYTFSGSDLAVPWRVVFTEAVPQMKALLTETDPASAENAVAKIWWVWIFHRVTDYYGPTPYFGAGNPGESVPYDSQEAMYNDFFLKLTEADAVLKANTGKTPYGSFDLLYQGNVSKWIKFGNTMRLRLALRLSKVNAAKAKTEAEAAFAAGVITDISDDALMRKVPPDGDDYGGLSSIAVWDEFRMSASMESVLKGYNDPRMGIYFQKSDSTNDYDGGRNGMSASELPLSINKPTHNSNVGTRWVIPSGTGGWKNVPRDQDILHSAEAFFLRAEGALNGWNMGGTAEALYNKGIEASMQQWGITGAAVTAYINSTATPIAPGDYFNSPPMNNYPIKWSTDPVMQRKQIAQQKWLALYPDGMEAWADLRRAGVQEIYKVVNSDNPDLPQGTFIRRLPFIDLEKQTNAAGVKVGESVLGGPDKASTPLWWDKN